jgi:hypothetical protein
VNRPTARGRDGAIAEGYSSIARFDTSPTPITPNMARWQPPAEQELRDQHRHRLAGDLGPAQACEPLDVDPVALGNC